MIWSARKHLLACRLLGVLLAMVVFSTAAHPQPEVEPPRITITPSAGAMKFDRAILPHAWAVIRESKQGDVFLVHIPPREAPGADGKLHGVPAGTLRVATRLGSMPLAMAAVDAGVYLVFAPDIAGVGMQVLSLEAVQSGVGDLWTFVPDGRLRTRPALPGNIRLLAFAGSPGGPVALVTGLPDPQPTKLLELRGESWRQTVLPTELVEMIERGGVVTTATIREGLRVRVTWDLVERWWTIRYESPSGPAIIETWKPGETPSDRSEQGEAGTQEGWIQSGGEVLRWSVEPGELVLWPGVAAGGPVLSRIELPSTVQSVAVLPLDATGDVLVARTLAPDSGSQPRSGGRSGTATLQITELSAATGRTLYDGPPRSANPIAAEDFRAVAFILFTCMALTIGLVLATSAGGDTVVLGEGMALASPLLRALAGLIDVAAAAAIAARLLGVPLADLLTPGGVLFGGGRLTLATVAVGLVLGVIGEALLGRSLGKILTGSEVVGWRRGDTAAGQPRLIQVLIRNVVKWLLPPVAILALIDPSGRHRGEVLSRTAVVVRFDTDEQQPE